MLGVKMLILRGFEGVYWTVLEVFGGIGGAQGQNRTVDTRIFSPLLYRLSYLGFAGISRWIARGAY
jgi:hypothetical protein